MTGIYCRLVRGWYVISTVEEDCEFNQIVLSPEQAVILREKLAGAVTRK